MPSANWYERNKEDQKRANKLWRETNREHDRQRKRDWYKSVGRAKDLMKRYGITVEKYDELYQQQNGSCAICFSTGKLCVDHDHTTGKVRGLLCYDCNRNFIGSHTDPDKYNRAAIYLRQDGTRHKV